MKILIILAIVLIFCQLSSAQNPEAARIMKRTIGSSLNGYTLYTYPTTNFGIGTVCAKKWVPKGIMVCDMIDTYGLSSTDENSHDWKTVNGYAHFGMGGPISLVDSTVRNYGASFLLPAILNALNISLSGYKVSNKSVNLTIDSAILRYLDFNKFIAFASSDKNAVLKDLVVVRKKAILATSDFVLLNYRIELRTNDSSGISIAAKLDTALAEGKILSKGDSIGVKISRDGNGVYTLQSSRPVIFAVMVKKQKNIGVLGEEKSFDDWPVVEPQEFDPKGYVMIKP